MNALTEMQVPRVLVQRELCPKANVTTEHEQKTHLVKLNPKWYHFQLMDLFPRISRLRYKETKS